MNAISPKTVNVFHDSRSEIRLSRCLYIASSAGLSMGSSLRIGFEKKISGREACHKSNKMDVSMYLVAVSMYPTP